METEKDIQLLLLNWYDGVVSMSSRITTGNLSEPMCGCVSCRILASAP